MLFRSSEVIDLDMSVDEALKYIISMGVVTSEGSGRERRIAAVQTAPLAPQLTTQRAANE